jgi:CRP-like cAMP-binding protein
LPNAKANDRNTKKTLTSFPDPSQQRRVSDHNNNTGPRHFALGGLKNMASRKSAMNSLLAALPDATYQFLIADLTPVNLTFDQALYEPGKAMRFIYFPIDCVLSVLASVGNQKPVTVGLIGYEGMLGVSVALGVVDSFIQVVVQSPGTALRMSAARFRRGLQQCPALQRVVLRYADAKLAQVGQAVACQCYHEAKARFACYLLMTSDRVRSEVFRQGQDSVAAMLGITRPTVSICARQLRQGKLISYSRGRIQIVNRLQLEAVACDCYRHGKILNTLSERSTECSEPRVANRVPRRRNR